jgi:hypothetical protein
MTYDYGLLEECWLTKETEFMVENPTPVTLCPPQIPYASLWK